MFKPNTDFSDNSDAFSFMELLLTEHSHVLDNTLYIVEAVMQKQKIPSDISEILLATITRRLVESHFPFFDAEVGLWPYYFSNWLIPIYANQHLNQWSRCSRSTVLSVFDASLLQHSFSMLFSLPKTW